MGEKMAGVKNRDGRSQKKEPAEVKMAYAEYLKTQGVVWH
jgi:hypothetical protein